MSCSERDPDCIFCKIVAGEIPSHKVYEDDDVLAFLDIAPTIQGHTLVIPKRHCPTLTETPPEILRKVAAVIPRVLAAVIEATDADGSNVLQSNGSCAGQVIWHVHFHLVPRHEGDPLTLGHRQSEPVEDDLAARAESIRAAM